MSHSRMVVMMMFIVTLCTVLMSVMFAITLYSLNQKSEKADTLMEWYRFALPRHLKCMCDQPWCLGMCLCSQGKGQDRENRCLWYLGSAGQGCGSKDVLFIVCCLCVLVHTHIHVYFATQDFHAAEFNATAKFVRDGTEVALEMLQDAKDRNVTATFDSLVQNVEDAEMILRHVSDQAALMFGIAKAPPGGN